MEILIVTGSSGRIGSQVIERFKNQYHIIGLDFVSPKKQNGDFEFIQMDVSSDAEVQKAMARIKELHGDKIAAFIHLAAYYNFAGGEWEKYENITVKGTERILIALETFNCELFMFSSTMLVHASTTPGHPLNENSPLLGSWEYPQSKIATEAAIQRLGKNKKTVILRIAGVYDDYCNSIPLSNQIQRIYEKQLESHLFPGNIQHGDSYLHMEDLIQAIDLVVEKRNSLPQQNIFLIGETQVLSYDQLQRGFSKLINGREITTIRVPKWFAKSGAFIQNHTPFVHPSFIKPWMIDIADQHYELDTSLATANLGWKTQHTLAATMPKMVAAIKQDPAKWYKHHELTLPNWLYNYG